MSGRQGRLGKSDNQVVKVEKQALKVDAMVITVTTVLAFSHFSSFLFVPSILQKQQQQKT
jgi:hypothetical protein